MRSQVWAAAAWAVAATAGQAVEAPRATIDTGVLVGSAEGAARVFKAIPFASPPVGALRWAPPQRPTKWRGERQATRFALPCAQPTSADRPNGGGVSGASGEDCLYLNVWAPKDAKNAPVMVWLYGGAGFLGGAHLGAYNGDAFARDGVIVVTANYRLGALGAFAHPALTRTAGRDQPLGSYALMDAVAALQWVRRNIEAFGGDPKNVTLFGQSAGGAMVMNLLATPAAKGLYQKAIVQSGAALRPGVPLGEAEAAGVKIAEAVGLPGAEATVDRLRAVPATTFVTTPVAQRGTGAPLDGRFRKLAAADALRAGKAIDVPLIVGTNSGEGGADAARTVAGWAAGGAPSFLYQFAYVPEWRRSEQANGAPHSAEIPYAFASLDTAASGGGQRVTQKDRQVAERVHACWVGFAKARKVDRSIPCADGFSWPAYDVKSDLAMVFRDSPSVQRAASLPPFAPPQRAAGGED
jgi:para-nitrobenzyl esterase